MATAVKRSPSKSKIKKLPTRSEVKPSDCWDLSSLFKSEAKWETAFKKWETQIPRYNEFAGKLGESAESLAACLEFDLEFDRRAERLGVYAHQEPPKTPPTANTSG
jgi:oligoendopeptidase F